MIAQDKVNRMKKRRKRKRSEFAPEVEAEAMKEEGEMPVQAALPSKY